MPRTQIDPYVWRLESTPPKKKKGQLGPIGVHPKKKQKKTSPESTVLHMKQGGSLLPPFPCKGGHPQFPHHQPSVRGGCASASPKMVEWILLRPGPPRKKKD